MTIQNAVMLVAATAVIAAAAIGCQSKHSGPDHSQHQAAASAGSQLVVQPTTPIKAGEETLLNLMIHRADGKMVREFDETHDAKVHLIIVREGLDEFRHLHPDVDASGNLTVRATFPASGNYRLYADFKEVGQPTSTAHGQIQVAGDALAAPALTANVPGSVASDGLRADVQIKGVAASGEVAITFSISDDQGAPVRDLEPYMAALGHLVLISADGRRYVHSHPVESSPGSNLIQFEAHINEPGLYKGWGQFKRAGQVRVIPFVVNIK